jgi:MFS family permease
MNAAPETRRAYVWLTLLAVMLGFALRAPGLFAGLPDVSHPSYSYHPDEVYHLEWARWLYEGQFVPKQFMYGGTLHFSVLHAYAMYGEWLGDRLPGINPLADALIVGRVASLMFALLTIVLTAQLGRHLFGATVGALAACCIALAPAAVFLTGSVRPDTLATLLATLAMLLAARILQWPARDARGRLLAIYAMSGVLLGAMIALRFPLGTFGLTFIAATGWREHGKTPWYRWLFDAPHWLLGIGALLGYAVASPHTLAHPDIAWLGLHVQWAYQSGTFEDAIGRGPGLWQYGVRMLAQGLGWFVYPVAIAGLVLALRVRHAGWLLWAGIAPYLLLTSFTSWVVVRYVLPLLPLLAIAAALAVVHGARYAQQRWRARAGQGVYAMALLLALATVATNLAFLRQYAPRDARDEAAKWLAGQAEPGSGVLTFWGYQGDVFFNPPLPDTLQQRVVMINDPLNIDALARDPNNQWLVVNASLYTNMDRLGENHPRAQVRDLAALLRTNVFELAAQFDHVPRVAGVDVSAQFDSQDYQILNPGIRVYRRRASPTP